MLPGDLAAVAGTPSNLGKIGDACEYFLSLIHHKGINSHVVIF